MDAASPIYRMAAGSADSCLRQGEIVADLRRLVVKVDSLGRDSLDFAVFLHPYAVVLTQDCDLEQDFNTRRTGVINDKAIPSILFGEVVTAAQLRGGVGINSTIWGQVKQNKHERYHFLQKVDPECDFLRIGLPELGIDFKRYFTLPTEEVYRRIQMAEAQRRCLLVSPYLEHLSNRFAHFLSRIALPQDHVSA